MVSIYYLTSKYVRRMLGDKFETPISIHLLVYICTKRQHFGCITPVERNKVWFFLSKDVQKRDFKRPTVGNQKSGINSPVFFRLVVDIPLFTMGFIQKNIPCKQCKPCIKPFKGGLSHCYLVDVIIYDVVYVQTVVFSTRISNGWTIKRRFYSSLEVTWWNNPGVVRVPDSMGNPGFMTGYNQREKLDTHGRVPGFYIQHIPHVLGLYNALDIQNPPVIPWWGSVWVWKS